MKELYFYPTLNETIAKDIGIEVEDFSFTYNDMMLKVDEAGVLRNPAEKTWLVQNNGMTMRTSIKVKSPENYTERMASYVAVQNRLLCNLVKS